MYKLAGLMAFQHVKCFFKSNYNEVEDEIEWKSWQHKSKKVISLVEKEELGWEKELMISEREREKNKMREGLWLEREEKERGATKCNGDRETKWVE